MKKIQATLVFCLIAVLILPPPSFAVNSDAQTAGAEESRFRQEEEIKELATVTEEKLKPIQPEIQETPAAEKKTEGISFILRDVEISGNQKISSEVLRSLARDYLGKEVSFAELDELGKKFRDHYRAKGFVAAYVYLPVQDVTDGVVKYEVAEGKLGEIIIKGNKWFSTRTLKRNSGQKPGQIISLNRLQQGLRFLNENRDVEAKASLKPGTQPQTTDLELDVKDSFPVHLSTDVNNLGTENTGKNRWGLMLQDTNLLTLMDQATGRVQLGKGFWAVGSDYNVPVNSYHTRVGFSYSRASVDVGGPFKALGVEGSASTYSLYIQQPIYANSWLQTSFQGGFDWKSIENKILNQVTGTDEFRIMNLGLSAEQNDSQGRTLIPQSVHFGFDNVFGASDKNDLSPTRPLTGGQFFIYRGSAIRYQKLPFEMLSSTRTSWQLTPDRLAPSEQFRLGGAYSVRGYPEGDYLADNGAFFSQEVFIPAYVFPKDWKLPYSSMPLYKQIQGVAFFDFGGGTLQNNLPAENRERTLAGMGGGVRIHLFDRVFARFQWAGRIGSKSTDGSDGAFYYGISVEMF